MDEFIYGVPEAEYGSPAWVDELTASAERFVDACVENSGPLLEHVDTDSTVRDLDMLRAVVGDPALHYFGYSYGTEIGARYADRFPERVGRLVLDGATDPTTTQFEVVLAQSIGFEAAAYEEAPLRDFSFNRLDWDVREAGSIANADNWRFSDCKIDTLDGTGPKVTASRGVVGL